MNKMNFVATAVALSALCLAGCSNDAEEPGTEPQPGRQVIMTMQASTAEPQTRADYTEDGNVMRFSWRANDAISVYVDGYELGSGERNLNCMLTTREVGQTVTFTGKADAWDGTRNIYAVYPYKTTDENGFGYIIDTRDPPCADLTLADPQEFTVGGAFTNGFLVGAGTATVEGGQIKVSPVSMKQVMSFVRFNITNAPGKVTQVKMAGQKSNGSNPVLIFPTQAFVFMNTGEITDAGTGTYKTELTMNVTDDTGPGNKSVSFALWPDDYTGAEITITITFEDGKVITLPTKQGMKFERNVHYVVDVDAGVYMWDGSSTAKPAGYTDIPGKVDITSAAELAWLAQQCNIYGNKFRGYTFNLTTDIDLDNHNWTPIGNFNNRFKGNFNGQGHTVRNMKVNINVGGNFYTGFFGYMEGSSDNPTKISNLIVEGNVSLYLPTSGSHCAGGICGVASYVDIEFCRFNGAVSGTTLAIPGATVREGGIVGDFGGDDKQSLTCCISDAEVTVNGGGGVSIYRGGLISELISSSVTYSAWNSSRTTEGVGRDPYSTFDQTTNKPFTDIAGLNDLLDDINNSKPESDYKWKAGDDTNTASPILVKRTPSGTN